MSTQNKHRHHETTPAAPEINPGLRIREIFFEIRGVSRVQDPEDKRRILKEYQTELEAIGAVRSSIRGAEGITENAPCSKLNGEGIRDYYATLNAVKSMLKEIATDARRLQAYKGKFWQSGDVFVNYFGPVTDQAVSAIFAQKYRVKGSKIEWRKSRADAWRFCVAAGLTFAYFNRVFSLENGADLRKADGHQRRTKSGAKEIMIPEIVRLVNRYHAVNKNDWPGYKWP